MKTEFATRAERDAYFSQRALKHQSKPNETVEIEVPDSMVISFKIMCMLFRFCERTLRVVWFTMAAMMATIIAGILLGILSA